MSDREGDDVVLTFARAQQSWPKQATSKRPVGKDNMRKHTYRVLPTYYYHRNSQDHRHHPHLSNITNEPRPKYHAGGENTIFDEILNLIVDIFTYICYIYTNHIF